MRVRNDSESAATCLFARSRATRRQRLLQHEREPAPTIVSASGTEDDRLGDEPTSWSLIGCGETTGASPVARSKIWRQPISGRGDCPRG